MKTRIDLQLVEEATRYALRFACEHCAHFDSRRERCGHGYPPGPRLGALAAIDLEFCKEFELGDANDDDVAEER